MKTPPITLSLEVTKFLDELNHPLRTEIDLLRTTLLKATSGLTESIKWNGPNYCYGDEDRITMRIQPPSQLQLIFHRGAKKIAQPKTKLIDDHSGLLVWKENDRAMMSFKTLADIENHTSALHRIVTEWIHATKAT